VARRNEKNDEKEESIFNMLTSTASEKMKKPINRRKRPLTNPATTSARTYLVTNKKPTNKSKKKKCDIPDTGFHMS